MTTEVRVALLVSSTNLNFLSNKQNTFKQIYNLCYFPEPATDAIGNCRDDEGMNRPLPRFFLLARGWTDLFGGTASGIACMRSEYLKKW